MNLRDYVAIAAFSADHLSAVMRQNITFQLTQAKLAGFVSEAFIAAMGVLHGCKKLWSKKQ